MGSTEATQDDELAIADISPSHDGTVFSKKKKPGGFVSKPSGLFGPSDRSRTCGILLPKQARYHLRYTRIFKLSRQYNVLTFN